MLSLALGLCAALAAPAAAQLLPQLPQLPRLGEPLPLRPVLQDTLDVPDRLVRQLADARLDRLQALVRAHPEAIELDPQGSPARAHEVVVTDPEDALIARATARGV